MASIIPEQVAVDFLIKGTIIGFAIAAPVGPIGLLCIRRTLTEGWKIGLVTGLGAATADATYGGVASFGLTAISGFLLGWKFWVGLAGGLFLCFLGLCAFFGKPPAESAGGKHGGPGLAYASTVVLTLANPMTILSFTAVVAGCGLALSPNYYCATAWTMGVFAGSGAWWLVLSWMVERLRTRISDTWLRVVNRLAGAMIFLFGVYSVAGQFPKH